MKIFIYALLIISILSACQSGTEQKIKKDPAVAILVNLDNENETSVFDIFSDIDIIPLETNEKSLFNYPFEKIVEDEGVYYILDTREKKAFMFDSMGVFIKVMDKIGRGPGEYIDMEDFNVNRYTQNAEFISSVGEILIYDHIFEKYVKKLRVPRITRHMINLTEDIDVHFEATTKRNKMFFYSRKEKKIIKECFPRPDFVYYKTIFKHTNSPFYVCNDTVCFYDGANGDIYTIDSDKLELKHRHQWDFGEYNFDISLLPPDEDMKYYMDFSNYGNNQYAFTFICNVENNDYLITRFWFRQQAKTIIYHKKNKDHFLFHTFKEGFQCMPLFINDKYLYSAASPDFLSLVINEKVLDEKNRKILSNIKENDNSVIIRYKFK
ncbi:MAG: 6-bladed beta-propeller [Bacteroidales bacterium]|jgi:hypothetical protein|nr:6-bladed beta-propeller [Bacteroidales bacterium]